MRIVKFGTELIIFKIRVVEVESRVNFGWQEINCLNSSLLVNISADLFLGRLS